MLINHMAAGNGAVLRFPDALRTPAGASCGHSSCGCPVATAYLKETGFLDEASCCLDCPFSVCVLDGTPLELHEKAAEARHVALREIRVMRRKGIADIKIAQHLGISKRSIYRWMSGK